MYIHICLRRVLPTVPARTLAEFCRDFPAEETKTISSERVSVVRNAFGEVVKQANRDHVADVMAGVPGGRTPIDTAHVFLMRPPCA